MANRIKKICNYNGVELETVWLETKRPYTEGLDIPEELKATHGVHQPFDPHTYNPLPEIICHQDVGVQMRDGVTIYCDIYRPANESEKVPVLISWSYYGKRPIEGHAFMYHMGVPSGTTSAMCKFESPDPGFWCRNGYAVANVDPRGVGFSEGDLTFYGKRDAQDGYDFIEWIAEQPWCNGKVGMGGNSQVAINQWFVAAEQPPHLAAIAPWEGSCDKYRESMYEGGIPAFDFNCWLQGSLIGQGYVDDMMENGKLYPFVNEYWEDKAAKLENVKVPCYLTASWSHFHMHGAFEAFRRIRTPRKWLRVHREFEWPDAYCHWNLNDLKIFFDRFLKDINNGWEMTPRVRLDVMDAYDFDIQLNRPEAEFPLKRTQYTRYYLDAKDMTMSTEPYAAEASVSYEAEKGIVCFDMAFGEDTELTGYMKLHLWVEADGNDDMDIFVNIQKADEAGNWLPTLTLGEPHPGQWGKMRASRRALDEKRSTEYHPVQLQEYEEKLSPGQIVPVDISIWPSCKLWHAGQKLRIQIAGHYVREGWFEPLRWETNNRGTHIIHTGGQFDSYLLAPVIPPKYTARNYVYR